MRIVGLLVAIAALAIVPTAAGDGVYHSEHIAFTPVLPGESGTGFVENIHANGPNVFAHEQYVVKGLLPLTTYEVTVHVSLPDDPTCTAPLGEVMTATITTNVAGNGTAFHVFTPADIASFGLHGLTVHPLWTLSTGGVVAYKTGCGTVQLD